VRSSPHNFITATAAVGSPAGERILEVAFLRCEMPKETLMDLR
jgi:hypothetical protein